MANTEVTPDQQSRSPMREFRLAEKALKNARHDYTAAGAALNSAMKRQRLAFGALTTAQRNRVLSE